MDFRGFLNDLHDWESSVKGKDKGKKSKPSVSNKVLPFSKSEAGNAERRPANPSRISKRDTTENSTESYHYPRDYDAMSRIANSFSTEESIPDAGSEKDLGNEYFKQKKFNEAIDCYSRSIALSPTAVAYANRAMAYLRIKRFREAEDDCTEVLSLDDRYIKAYSRRATARKELGKFKESLEDAEFCLRLEPDNPEIKKQYAEAKSLYDQELRKKAPGALKNISEGLQKPKKVDSEQRVHVVSSNTQGTGEDAVLHVSKESSGKVSVNVSTAIKEVTSKGVDINGENASPKNNCIVKNGNNHGGKQNLGAAVQELANRAASRAISEAAKNITAPKSAYEFEVSWQGFSGDHSLQASLLKVTSPVMLPQIFKNALSAPLLVDIIKCVSTFFVEDMDLAVKYLENLPKVPRFDMLMMCLSSADKAELIKIWDEVFCSEATPIEYAEIIDSLRLKYCLK